MTEQSREQFVRSEQASRAEEAVFDSALNDAIAACQQVFDAGPCLRYPHDGDCERCADYEAAAEYLDTNEWTP